MKTKADRHKEDRDKHAKEDQKRQKSAVLTLAKGKG